MATRIKTSTETANWDRDPVLTVEHLTMRFGGLVAVGDLSFNVGRGDITALIGPNGAGKTTVFNCVTGFYKPTEGRIVMRHGPGRQEEAVEAVTDTGSKWAKSEKGAVYLLERMPDHEISHKARVARTFQNIRLFGGMTVLENLLVAQHNPLMVASGFSLGGILGLPSYKKAQQEAIDKAVYWLERTDLIDRADDPAADLPYGAQRRLEIARAMCTGPELLCLDEPAAGLNPRESADLNQLLKYIRDEHNVSVLLIEHDMGVVMEISDHVIVLDYGVKISDGAADFVKNDPKVIAAYLGVDDEEEIDVPEVRKDVKEAEKTARKPAGKRSASATKATARKSTSAKSTAAKSATAKSASVKSTGAKGSAGGTPASSPAKGATTKGKAAPARAAGSRSSTAKPAAAKSATAKSAPAKKPARASSKKAAAPAAGLMSAGAAPASPAKKTAAARKAPRTSLDKGKAATAKTGAEKASSTRSTTTRRTSSSKAKPASRASAAKPATAQSEVVVANADKYPGSQPHGTKKPRAGGANNLTRVRGIGPANEKKLNKLGIWHFDQIASWKKREIEWVGSFLSFPGRIEREDWVKQAKVLAKGGETEFSKRVDKGAVPTSVPGRRGAQAGKPAAKKTAKGGKA